MQAHSTRLAGLLVASALAALLASCQSNGQGLYLWGEYEDSVWSLTHAEGAADIDAQIDVLLETIEKARMTDRRVPPGMHAHVGMLYSMRGEMGMARAALESERELYPESTVFIDGIIARMEASR